MTSTPKKLLGSGGDGSGDGAQVVERVVANGALDLPMLTRANYQEWALVMQVNLEAMGQWSAVEGATGVER